MIEIICLFITILATISASVLCFAFAYDIISNHFKER